MKIVVIGGGGLIGKKLVTRLRERGHEAWQPPLLQVSTPIRVQDWLMHWRVRRLLSMRRIHHPFEDAAVLEFFETSTRNLLAAVANFKNDEVYYKMLTHANVCPGSCRKK
jgi:nucleoside-diphosphate-sugar epimerase